MTAEPNSHIEPSEHSTREVDEILREVENKVDDADGAGSPAIKPNKQLDEDGKPLFDIDRPVGGQQSVPAASCPTSDGETVRQAHGASIR